MSPPAGDEHTPQETQRPGGLANVFRGLTKSTRSPPLATSSASSAAFPRTDFVHATPTAARPIVANHVEALELLKTGTLTERIEAANTLKYSISEFPLNPVLDIWYTARDLIDSGKPVTARCAGWELLSECVKHGSSTDLERKEYFQTLTTAASPDDFHLQLAALVDLTSHGRTLTGFDYELLPLLTSWLQDVYLAAQNARKNATQYARGSKPIERGRLALSGEEKNFASLFGFLINVIKFSFNSADDRSVSGLIDRLLSICMSTTVEEDLRSCIAVIDTVVTYGSIPDGKLKDCIEVLSSIFCLVHKLQKDSWQVLANLCRSHNGQATVRILLDILRNPTTENIKDKDSTRPARGAVAVLQKLISKTTERGYPTVPYSLLVDGMSQAVRAASSLKVDNSILSLINFLFDDGEGYLQRIVVDEDWSPVLAVAVECSKRASRDPQEAQTQQAKNDLAILLQKELLTLVARLDELCQQKGGDDYVPRQTIVKFFTDMHDLLPDNAAHTVLNYFREFRCCSPSDLQWEENLAFVLEEFFRDRTRSSDIRLSALETIMDAYLIVDLVGDGEEQNFIPRLAKSLLRDIAEETDIPVLHAVTDLMISVVTSCDMELFDHIIDALKGIIDNDRLKAPIGQPSIPMGSSTAATSEKAEASPSNAVAKSFVKMFVQLMDVDGDKSVKLYNALVNIAKSSHSEVDARLTAMKLLFRLRADYSNRIFITSQLETSSLAEAICRTEASLAQKQAEEKAVAARHSRSENAPRPSRGVSFTPASHDKAATARNLSSARVSGIRQQQMWMFPDSEAIPGFTGSIISNVLVSAADGLDSSDECEAGIKVIDIRPWVDSVLHMLQGCDWEIYSFALVHLPSQLSNHAIFRSSIPQIQKMRERICEQIRRDSFQEPPATSGLRKADVAICLYHSLTMLISYHEHFGKNEEDDIVKTFILGFTTWERTATCCIHALSVCCHELPLSTSKSLPTMLKSMATIITQPHVSVHILEFLACLSRLHHVFVNFREEEYRIVFAVCFRYLEYAKEKKGSNRASHVSESAATTAPTSMPPEVAQTSVDELPQYVHALAYHVILFWFLAMKLPDRATHVGWVIRKMFLDADSSGPSADEQTITTIDFLQRVTYADADESVEDKFFTEDRYGEIKKKSWLIGNSIVTVKQAKLSGWAHIVKRSPSGTSAYTVREAYQEPPPHQVKNHVDVSREGQETTNEILPSHLLLQLMSPVPQSFDSARPIPLPDDDLTERSIRLFDLNSTVDGHKVGVIYIGENQNEETDILSNMSGSRDYITFLNKLGTLTRLKGATFNTQGLDKHNDIDGEYTFCWRDRVTEIVFHVTTQMPSREDDPQYDLKKKHIGNDFVNIIFNDSGLPFAFDTFPSQFNFVNIVITPASRATFVASREAPTDPSYKPDQPFYRVQVLSKPGFPEISPASETKMVSLSALPDFIRLLALNASMFSLVWNNLEGGEHISSWSHRLRQIRRLRERCGSKVSSALGASSSPPPTGVAGAASTLSGIDGSVSSSRPSSTVRDSFNSLRRTSVATFFTATSEPPASGRSSTMASSATNETEVGNPCGGNVIDSVDFSKWA